MNNKSRFRNGVKINNGNKQAQNEIKLKCALKLL